ncbi:hypothetical protein [Piscirickettsia salmonis]|uniref:hypothetical protein n=1 Tax=Piscirickettsia salmonis TaxID=1238 RepID=UPI001389EAD7|nr:hypothetical protein [Piscirickettsia salmonis]
MDIDAIRSEAISDSIGQILHELEPIIGSINLAAQNETSNRKRRYLGRYFAHPMMQIAEQNATTINPRLSAYTALHALNRHTPLLCSHMTLRFV